MSADRAGERGKPRAQLVDDDVRVVDRERRLGQVRDLLRVVDLERVEVLERLDQRDRLGGLAHRALDLLVAVVTDEDDRLAALREAAGLGVDLVHERAGRVDHVEPARGRVCLHLRRDAVRGEDDGRAVRHLVELLDEDRAALLELTDDVDVVDDLLADVDRGAALVERALDDLDRALHAGAERARPGEQHPSGAGRRGPFLERRSRAAKRREARARRRRSVRGR